MIIRRSFKILIIALNMVFATASFAHDCPRHLAPGKFNNPNRPWGTTDTGAIVDGFVDLSRPATDQGSKSIYKVQHGVDLSRFNTVDYGEIAACGGTFAFVQMDEKFDDHIDLLKQHKVHHMPYVFFKIPKEYRRRARYGDEKMSPTVIQRMMAIFDSLGIDAGRQSVVRLGKLGTDAFLVTNMAGVNEKIIGLDIEEKLIDEKGSSKDQRKAFGRFYAHAVCSWIRTVSKSYPDTIIFLYTTPSVVGDYLQYAYPEDNRCLSGLPIWIARTTLDAGDVIRSSNKSIDRFTERMCKAAGNRCVIHQYTHRATFGARGKELRKGQPPHLDLDRFFMIRKLQTEAGYLFVRSDE